MAKGPRKVHTSLKGGDVGKVRDVYFESLLRYSAWILGLDT